MSVVVIGDRQVGKTMMVVTLAKGTENVKIVSPIRFNPELVRVAGTFRKEEETLLINVNLPAGERQIQVRWVDTPGEAWSNKNWRQSNPTAWEDLKKEVSQSQSILLLMPPHRNLIQTHLWEKYRDPENERDADLGNFPRPEAWKNNLTWWLNFFRENCPRVQHILISIHKADFFCAMETEATKWRYDSSHPPKWFEYNKYIRETYFGQADDIIRQYNSQEPRATLRFFITTINNPSMLELPWLYLGAYLANS